MPPKTRVLICDDHELFRKGVRAVLEDENWLEVVGEAENGREGVAQTDRHEPDVVLMDVQMPEMTGIEATHRIRSRRLPTKVLMLTEHSEDDVVALCLNAGASGYVLKYEPASQLVYALRTVCRGGRYLSPEASSGVIARTLSADAEEVQTRYNALTAREREILKLLADGRSVKEIAADMKRSLKTIDAHKTNLMRKLGVHDRTQLLKYALLNRLVRFPTLE
jgi:two-component system, NarL family, response regulator NreC